MSAIRFIFASATLISSLGSTGLAAQELKRPPQYVVFAFDGSKSLKFWQDTRDFSKSMAAQNTQVPFTYFLSGTVFLKDNKKTLYQGPKHSPGQSDISFGGNEAELTGRIQQMNKAIEEGHEMGSHANGHFNGEEGRWSESDWSLEFKLFNWLIKDVFTNNELPSSLEPLNLDPEKEVVGFRAPYLGVTSGLWPTLENYKFRYDTSLATEPNYWPRKNSKGIWNFPLAMIRIVDTNKRTLSMDYNFYVADSNASPNPANSEIYRSRMKRSYLKYFNDNYAGNRAPVHIGHHFSLWNGGAYYNALKDFAQAVCGKAEVKCVTHKELADDLDELDDETLAQYQRGNFNREDAPTRMKGRREIKTTTKFYNSTELKKLGIEFDPPAAHEEY